MSVLRVLPAGVAADHPSGDDVGAQSRSESISAALT